MCACVCEDNSVGKLHLCALFVYLQYVRPLFRELLRSKLGRDVAVMFFKLNSAAYHPICSKMVSVDIVKETAKPPIYSGDNALEGWAPPVEA